MLQVLDYDALIGSDGQVLPEHINDLLVEVIHGKYLFEVHGSIYASCTPDRNQIDQARLVYARRLNECRAAGLMTQAEMEAFAVENGVFDPVERAQKQALGNHLKRLVKQRDDSTSPQHKVLLAQQITATEKKLNEAVAVEQVVFANCAEYRAQDARASFLAFCCTLGGDLLNEPVWPDWASYEQTHDVTLLLESRKAHLRVSTGLSVTIIRALARTPEWRQRWKAAKESGTPLFEGFGSTWDQNKLNLISWSDFFDSVLAHPECPGDDLIQDDEALQNWVNQQVAKARQARQQNQSGAPIGGVKKDGGPVTYIDGSGRRRPMKQAGRTTYKINQGYRVRTGEEQQA